MKPEEIQALAEQAREYNPVAFGILLAEVAHLGREMGTVKTAIDRLIWKVAGIAGAAAVLIHLAR